VAHASTRTEAAGRLALALERLHVGGVTTNRDFLAATLRHPRFLDGDTTTDFIDRVSPPASIELSDSELDRVATTAALWLQARNRSGATVLSTLPTGWRNARLPAQHLSFTHGDRTVEVSYRSRRDGSFTVGDGVTARVYGVGDTWIDAEVDGRRARSLVTRVDGRLHVQAGRGTVELDLVPRFLVAGAEAPSGGLAAPMPGVVLDVRAAAGDHVTARQILVVLEAMKMEHHVVAAVDGVVSEVLVSEGQQVQNGELLLVVEPHEGES
jgi:propionyl-CoA carboxylase alpha chain